MNTRLILGTAQLGFRYGIANTSGKPDRIAATSIIQSAFENQICQFDTAQCYGDSESVLGEAFHALDITDTAKVYSKFSPNQLTHEKQTLVRLTNETLTRLRAKRLHCLMIHAEDIPYDSASFGDMFTHLKETGLVSHIGISIYSPAFAIKALASPWIDVVQIPSNAIDRRFENANVFDLAQRLGKVLIIRSIFLQGLLLMDEADAQRALPAAVPYIRTLVDLQQGTQLSRNELLMGYAKLAYGNSPVIFGAETVDQLLCNVCAWDKQYPIDLVSIVRKAFPNTEETIVNPSLWNLN